MTTNKPPHLVPKLRFPEFQRVGDWKREQIGKIASIIKGKGLSKADITEGGATPCIRYAELYTHYGEVIHEVVSRTNVPHEDLMLSQAEDVIVPASGETKVDIARAACVLLERVALGSDLNIIRSDLYGSFFSYLLNSPLRHTIAQMAQGDTVAHLYPRQLSLVWLAYPLRPEQQKIADCLGSLDDLIAAEGRKLDALRQHKQGLMQQLFPQPGETVPRLRFSEFEDAPAWESSELGVMTSKIGSGVTPRGGAKNYRSSGRPFVRSQNVGWGELILDNVVHIDEDTHASFAATEVEEGDVLLNISGASIGRSAVADARIAGGNVNQHVCIIRALSEQTQAWFLNQYLISRHGQDQIDRCQAGGNRQGLNFGQIRSFLIPQPRDVAEQERIAECLRTADILIATQVQRISTLKHQKQGLLEQLFPSLEAV